MIEGKLAESDSDLESDFNFIREQFALALAADSDPLTGLIRRFKDAYPDFKTFEHCGERYLTDEDDYKREAGVLFDKLLGGWFFYLSMDLNAKRKPAQGINAGVGSRSGVHTGWQREHTPSNIPS